MKLFIGNKAYSSWSLRGWLAAKHSGLPFEEITVPLYDEEWNQRREGDEFAPSGGKVPILWDGDDIVVWDSLAIIDYLNEKTGGDQGILARGYGGARDGAVDGGRNAFELCRAAPQSQHEHPPHLSRRAAAARSAGRCRPHPANLGRGAGAVRRRGRLSVRRLVGRRHDVRAGGHALHHLLDPAAALCAAPICRRWSATRACRTGSAARRPRTG